MKLAQETNETVETSTDTNEYQKFEAQFEADNQKQRVLGFLVVAGVILVAFGLLFGTANLMQTATESVNQYLGTEGSDF